MGKRLSRLLAGVILIMCSPLMLQDAKAGWPVDVNDQVWSSPVLADINGDGKIEVVVGTSGGSKEDKNGSVYIWRYDGVPYPGWPKQVDGLTGPSNPAVGNLDPRHDGLEIVIGTRNGKIYAWYNNGSLMDGWPKTLPGAIFASPVIADLNNDGQLDIIIGCGDSKVYAYNSSGVSLPGWPKAAGTGGVGTPIVADITGNGRLEVLVTGGGGETYLWDAQGQIIPGWPKKNLGTLGAVGDFDPKHKGLEIVFSSKDALTVLRNDGTVLPGWPKAIQSPGQPAVGDIDGDGTLEIVVSSNRPKPDSALMYAFHSDGRTVSGWPADPAQVPGYYINAVPVLKDLDGDGKLEIIAAHNCYSIHAWHYDGSRVQNFPITGIGWQEGSPAIADLDNNGRFEIVFGGNKPQVNAIQLPFSYRVSQYQPDAADTKKGYFLYKKPVFELVLPSYYPSANENIKENLSFFAAINEYEPVTFSIYGLQALQNVKVYTTDLKFNNNTIPSSDIDVRIVKVWKQAHELGPVIEKAVLIPELLVKDDRIELKGYFSSMPLTPYVVTDIPANSSKQIWITVKTSAETKPGAYSGVIHIQPANAPESSLKLELNVLPINLLPPNKNYSIFYTGAQFGMPWNEERTSDMKRWEDMVLKELIDMREHGLQSATIFVPLNGSTKSGELVLDFSNLKKALTLHKEAGLIGPTAFEYQYSSIDGRSTLDYRSYYKTDEEQKLFYYTLEKMVKQVLEFNKKEFNNTPPIFFYGLDEANRGATSNPVYNFPPDYSAGICKKMFEATHRGGGLNICAVYRDPNWGALDILGPLTDLPIYSGVPEDTENIKEELKTKKSNHIWYYWQCWEENPKKNRLLAGLALWKSGCTGVMPWAYNAGNAVDPYYDFNNLKTMNIVYPSKEGPIPTLAWEAFREGVDDVRYLTTLTELLKKQTDQKKVQRATNFIEKTMARVDLQLTRALLNMTDEDFQNIRWEIAQEIIELTK